jgi:hypothetical protein
MCVSVKDGFEVTRAYVLSVVGIMVTSQEGYHRGWSRRVSAKKEMSF